jgi:hypothetical protein
VFCSLQSSPPQLSRLCLHCNDHQYSIIIHTETPPSCASPQSRGPAIVCPPHVKSLETRRIPGNDTALKGAVHEFQIARPGCALLLYIHTSHALLLHPLFCDAFSNSCDPHTSLAQLRTTDNPLPILTTHRLNPPRLSTARHQSLTATRCVSFGYAQGLSSHPHAVHALHGTPSINASRIASIATAS